MKDHTKLAPYRPAPILSALILLSLAPASPSMAQSGAGGHRISPDWLTVDKETKTASMEITAGLTTANSAWNFNGYANGDMSIVVPKGWTVRMHFRNRDASVPHSVGVVEIMDEIPPSGDQMKIAFPGAFTVNFTTGLSSMREDHFDFTVARVGRFWMACGVPPHARAGMWDYFVVSDTISEPYVEAGTQDGGTEGGGTSGAETQERAPRPLEWDGHLWSDRLSPAERTSFLTGFVAGASAAQVYPEPKTPADAKFDADSMASALARLRAEGKLKFPYAPSVYAARLHDWLFYLDRRDQPLYRALAEINYSLGHPPH